jgi:hypothetical protein
MFKDNNESEWVHLVDTKLVELAQQQGRIEERQTLMESQLQLNNEVTLEIHDILIAAKGAFKFLGWVGQFASWLIKIGAFIAASYATLKVAFPHVFKG